MKITKSIKYVGVNDRDIDLFEGQFPVPDGIAYNSYVILDEKIAVMDSVEIAFKDEWIGNILSVTGGRAVDYLVIHHMEPDHSSSIRHFMDRFPTARIISSERAFNMMSGFFGTAYEGRRIIVSEGDVFPLGRHRLRFFSAPMVHWPEVLVSYDMTDRVLFSADAFGKFGCNDIPGEWEREAGRYYFGIVGKYGAMVSALLKKLEGLDIDFICSLHGPVICKNIDYYISLYNKWAAYLPDRSGVCIACASIYGNTAAAAGLLEERLNACGVKTELYDLARCDIYRAVESAFRFDRLVLASSTYNGGLFPPMREFLGHLTDRGYKNRTVAFIENGSWAQAATKAMKAMLEGSKNLSFIEPNVSITSSLNDESRAQIIALSDKITENCD